jgi:hypothetical protein
MLRNWFKCIDIKTRGLIFVKVAALMWVICCSQNDIIFEKKIHLFYARGFQRSLLAMILVTVAA